MKVTSTRVWVSDAKRLRRIARENSTGCKRMGCKEAISMLVDLYDKAKCPECGTVNHLTRCSNCGDTGTC